MIGSRIKYHSHSPIAWRYVREVQGRANDLPLHDIGNGRKCLLGGWRHRPPAPTLRMEVVEGKRSRACRTPYDQAADHAGHFVRSRDRHHAAAPANDDAPAAKPPGKPRKKARRNIAALPKHLPRCEHVLEPDTRGCPCCQGRLHKIGEDVREVLDVIPAIQHDLGYFDDETCRLEPLLNPFGPKVLPMSPE